MKRILAIILAAALLLSMMCSSVFAANTITEVDVTYTCPTVGDAITKETGTVTSTENVFCNVQYIFEGDAIEQVLAAASSGKGPNDFSGSAINTSLSSAKYASHQYLVVVNIVASEGYALSDPLTLSLKDGIECKKKLSYNGSVYAYLTFTPRADTTQPTPEVDTTQPPANESEEVYVRYDDSVVEKKVYSVEITWGSLEFTYKPFSNGTWDPDTHEYSDGNEAGWSWEEGANAITVENHSNAVITASFEYSPKTSFGIAGAFFDKEGNEVNDGKFNVASAVNSDYSNAPSVTAYLELTGTLDSQYNNKTQSGSVTVSIQ